MVVAGLVGVVVLTWLFVIPEAIRIELLRRWIGTGGEPPGVTEVVSVWPPDASAEFRFGDGCDGASLAEIGTPSAIAISFDLPSARSFCGWGLRLEGVDLRGAATLQMRVRAEPRARVFRVGLLDHRTPPGSEPRARLRATRDWMWREIALSAFAGVDLSRMDNVSLTVSEAPGHGTVFVDSLRFVAARDDRRQ